VAPQKLRRDVVTSRGAFRAVSEQVSDVGVAHAVTIGGARIARREARVAAFRWTGRMDGVRSGKARWTRFSGSPVTRK
jgi:hypothetical protein